MINKLIALFFLCFSASGFANPTSLNNYSFVVCNSCYSASSFELGARSGHLGYVLVVNLNTKTAIAYNVTFDPSNYNELETVSPLSRLPAGTHSAIDEYHAFKSELERLGMNYTVARV